MNKISFKKFADRNSVVGNNYTTSITTDEERHLPNLNMTFRLSTITEAQIKKIIDHPLYGNRYFKAAVEITASLDSLKALAKKHKLDAKDCKTEEDYQKLLAENNINF